MNPIKPAQTLFYSATLLYFGCLPFPFSWGLCIGFLPATRMLSFLLLSILALYFYFFQKNTSFKSLLVSISQVELCFNSVFIMKIKFPTFRSLLRFPPLFPVSSYPLVLLVSLIDCPSVCHVIATFGGQQMLWYLKYFHPRTNFNSLVNHTYWEWILL